MRLGVYCDYAYRQVGDELSAELPFGLFLRQLGSHCDRLVLIGRLDPGQEPFPYRMTGADFVALPHYASGAHLADVLRTVSPGLRRIWRMLDDLDVLWILGPNPPQALLFALLAKLRRRRLVLGVRQDLPKLIHHRYPGNRLLPLLAWILEGGFRLTALTTPVVVVGPDLALRYRHARATHVAYVSLLAADQIASAGDLARSYDGPELWMLSVGRLDPEKNPLLLADILAAALAKDPRWRLAVCGTGTLLDALTTRLRALGVLDRARLHGYVPIDGGLWDLYRQSHMLIHVSHTEGVPQVLLEAFAARLPVVATDVGGVAALAGDCSLLVAPDDSAGVAAALERLAGDGALRTALVERGVEVAREHTIEAECLRLAAFLSG
ncbi:MAG: glycosyltransferase [Solirubrobacteraceae bacterium]